MELRNITKVYREGTVDVTAVDDVSLDLRKGELLLLMGPSGSGKTTLLSLMGCILSPSRGEILLEDTTVSGMSERELPGIRKKFFGFVFQSFNLFPFLTALENVELVLRMKVGDKKAMREEARTLLQAVGLGDRAGFYPRDLSGGQKQRVAFARALVGNPPVILADEPTANLDSKMGREILELLKSRVRGTEKSVVIVSHDPKAEAVADRVLYLEDGRLRA